MTEELVRAFNDGCDARLRGEKPRDNPHECESRAHAHWSNGWWDVQEHWGDLVRGRWSVRPLPAVL
jgi:hypothetical protein